MNQRLTYTALRKQPTYTSTLKTPPLVSLKQHLTRGPRLPDGFLRLKYPTDRFDLRKPILDHIRDGGFAAQPLPLETLHERVAIEQQIQARPGGSSALDKVKTSVEFLGEYHRLVKYLAQEVLGYDVLLEESPNVRFHFPVPSSDRFRVKDGRVLAYHVDQFFADPFEQINCWLPFGSCFGQNTMHWSTLSDGIAILDEFCADFEYDEETFVTTGRGRFFDKLNSHDAFQRKVVESCTPLVADYGEVVLFDGRIIHGTMENTDRHTRVSFDFRILPRDDYEAIERRYTEAGLPLPIESTENVPIGRGGFYHTQTAFEI